MGRERLWDQGSLCPRGSGTQKGWGWQCCPQPGDTRSRLSSPPLISWFIGATCLFYRAFAHPTEEEMGTQQVTWNFWVMSTWTSEFHLSTLAAATWQIPGTEHRHKHFPTAAEMPNKGSCQDL